MATVMTPEQIDTEMTHAPKPREEARSEPRRIVVDGSMLGVLGVGIALFTMAFGAFTHLSGRIDNLSGRMDSLDAKLEKLSAEQRAESREINARLDRLFELVISQGRRDAR